MITGHLDIPQNPKARTHHRVLEALSGALKNSVLTKPFGPEAASERAPRLSPAA